MTQSTHKRCDAGIGLLREVETWLPRQMKRCVTGMKLDVAGGQLRSL